MDEACHFLGARFARTVSSCDAGVCVGVTRLPSGRYSSSFALGGSAVACGEAQLRFGEFLGAGSRWLGDRQELLYESRSTVLPFLTLLAFGSASDAEQVESLCRFEESARKVAADDMHEWRMFVAPFLLESTEIAQARQLFVFILHAAQNRPFTHGSLVPLLQAGLHFYFDIAALLGHHFLAPDSVEAASRIVQSSVPRYRPLGCWEAGAGVGWEGVPTDAHRVVSLSSAIDRLGDLSANVSDADVSAISQLLIGWRGDAVSSTKTLLSYQVRASLCWSLTEVAAKLVASNADQLAISLLDLCRPVLSVSKLVEVHDVLTTRLARASPPGGSAAALLGTSDLASSLGRPGAPVGPIAGRIERTLLGDIPASKVEWILTPRGRLVRFAANAAEKARAFGRALGRRILHGAGLQTLHLHPDLARWLHPRIRMSICDLAHVRATIAPTTLEELLYISWGLGEVLGPGGFEIYSNHNWMLLITSTYV